MIFGLSGLGRLGDAFLDSMASAIQAQEGWILPGQDPRYPKGSLSYQNNNPGNLRFNKGGWNFPGATQGVGGFAAYPSYSVGLAALQHQIQVQVNSGQNLIQFVHQYAPSSDNNNEQAYVSFVASRVNIDPSVPLINYQNGTTPLGPGSGSSTPPSPDSGGGDITPVTDGADSAPSSGPIAGGTSFLDTLNNLDPVVVGGAAVLGLGVLYVLFG